MYLDLPSWPRVWRRLCPNRGLMAMPCWWAPITAKQLSMAAPAGVIWWCACVRYWPYRGVSTCASVLKLVLTKGFFERWTSTGSELLAIYDTGKPPVSNRSKCEDLVVAHGRFDCKKNHMRFLLGRCPDTSTFWMIIYCTHFLSYEMCGSILNFSVYSD